MLPFVYRRRVVRRVVPHAIDNDMNDSDDLGAAQVCTTQIVLYGQRLTNTNWHWVFAVPHTQARKAYTQGSTQRLVTKSCERNGRRNSRAKREIICAEILRILASTISHRHTLRFAASGRGHVINNYRHYSLSKTVHQGGAMSRVP